MSKTKTSAGILLYRLKEGSLEVMLVHPGGPYYKNKDDGVWDVPKGEADAGETDMVAVARREFEEETGMKPERELKPLGMASRPDKTVHVWAMEGDFDVTKLRSNTCFIDWPPRSGKKTEIPEVDRAEFFTIDKAKDKIRPYLVPILDKLSGIL